MLKIQLLVIYGLFLHVSMSKELLNVQVGQLNSDCQNYILKSYKKGCNLRDINFGGYLGAFALCF